MNAQDTENSTRIEKKQSTQHTREIAKTRSDSRRNPLTRGIALIFCCFVASFLGAWLFVNSGLVRVDSSDSITKNREKIVLQEGEVVSEVAAKVSPSVVSIVIAGEQRISPFTSVPQEGAGTGIVVSKDGYILTNSHVVPQNVSDIQVMMSDETIYSDVRVIGRDPLNDIAFLKINGVSDLEPAVFGDSSKVEVGQKVVAIGNALGQYQTSVTSGIISAVGRPLVATAGDGGEAESLENLFQTDAAINPGNSGGPLVSLKGEVIGINTAVAASAEGIGFAIPINDAKGLLKNVMKNGRAERAYLGVRYTTITPALATEEKLPVKQGAYIAASGGSAVIQGTPAAKAGLRDGDIVTKLNGTKLDRRNPLASLLALYTVGDTVDITVLRNGKEQVLKATLEAYRS